VFSAGIEPGKELQEEQELRRPAPAEQEPRQDVLSLAQKPVPAAAALSRKPLDAFSRQPFLIVTPRSFA